MDAYTWMDYFFTSYGCKVPNSDQIHVDHMEMKVLWQEYVDDLGEVNSVVIIPSLSFGIHAFLVFK